MDLRQIKVVVAVADAGGFTAAARRPHVSGPPCPARSGPSNASLARPFFDRTTHRRTTHRAALTPAGEVFVPAGRATLHAAEWHVRRSTPYRGICAGG